MSDNQDDSIDDDPWGAAIAEQAQAEAEALEKQQAQAASAAVFKDFSSTPSRTETHNDIDFILDIPVQLTVELGRTKIAIKNLLQ
ncbi:MAG: flagellar motor switch protein FliN, partial [Pseudomonadota bacterium]